MKDKQPIQLQSRTNTWRDIFWDDKDHVMKDFFENGVDIEDDNVRHLIQELDRRFVQLADKVRYEREKNND